MNDDGGGKSALSDGLGARLRSLKVLLSVDAPEVRGWAPVVQQEAQRVVNEAIAYLRRAERTDAALQSLLNAFHEGRAGPTNSLSAGYVQSVVDAGERALMAR